MANMIEQSLLCKVLDAPDLEILHSNGVVEEMFLTCKDEIHFIIEHYNSYKQMPDKITFLGRFKDFQMLEVTESTDYLVYKLKEAYTYTKLVPLIEDTAKVVKEDSIKAIQYLKEEIEKLEKSVPVSRNKDGYDIISNAGDRLTEYKKRCEVRVPSITDRDNTLVAFCPTPSLSARSWSSGLSPFLRFLTASRLACAIRSTGFLSSLLIKKRSSEILL